MRRLRGLSAALVLTAALAACSAPLPTPEPEALPASAPVALGAAQVSRILGEVTSALSAADEATSGDDLAPRITGTAAEIRTAQYVQAAAGESDALTEIPATPQTVIAPATDTWPRTMMVVTHEMSFARDVSSEVIFMHQGEVCEQGAPDAMFSAPKTEQFAKFISDIR